jgi:hypothetical protein
MFARARPLAAGPPIRRAPFSRRHPPHERTMRLIARALPLLAAASWLVAVPALAQESGLVRIDPCTGKPYPARTETPGPDGSPSGGMPSAAQPGPGTPSSADPSRPGAVPSASPSSGSGAGQSGVTPQAGTPAAGGEPPMAIATSSAVAPGTCRGRGNPEAARRMRQALRLGRGAARGQVRLGPAASVSVPTAFGVDAGELFVGVAYQGRTRYTEEDDAAVVAGLGLGTRRLVAVEVAVTSYSTVRGGFLETGGVSVKLHRAVSEITSVAVGWDGSDDDGSLYAAATRIVPLRRDPAQRFGVAVFTLGVGNGRFRFEEDLADDKEMVNLFAAAGVRVSEPLSLVADWTGQDLNLAASVTPIRRVPLVLTAGVADVTGMAGDGARFIVSLGYGLSIRQPF